MKNFLVSLTLGSCIFSPPCFGSNSYVIAVSSAHSADQSFRDLQFADRDADRFVEAMRQVGFVENANIVRIRNPKVADLKELARRIRINGKDAKSSKVVFYYSGHADDRGLHLNDGYFNETQLRLAMSSLPSQTKIGILDSCFGGGFQSKGFAPVPAFEIPKANFDEPSGSVFITASASGEFAYESRRLKGSVFTDSLVAGLYGDADGNGDGLVTVDELYQHTYSRLTWKGAALPMRPAQSPAIISDLRGKGAVVLAYPSKVDATLKFPSLMSGEISLATSKGLQMYSISKTSGAERRIRLPSGHYRVTVLDGWRVGRGMVRLASAGETELQGHQIAWTDVEVEPAEKKGAAVEATPSTSTVEVSVASAPPPRRNEGRLILQAGPHTGFYGDYSARHGSFAKIGWNREAFTLGRWSVSPGIEMIGAQASSYVYNRLHTKSYLGGFTADLMYQAPWRFIPARMGGEFAAGYANHFQTYQGNELEGTNAYAGVRFVITAPLLRFRLALRASVATELVANDSSYRPNNFAKSYGLGFDYKI